MSKKEEKSEKVADPKAGNGEEASIDETLINGGYDDALAAAEQSDRANKISPRNSRSAVYNMPSPDKVRAAVAKKVLEHLDEWPPSIIELVGKEHPNEESFINGVPYVLRAYMTIAMRKAEKIYKDETRKAELEAARQIGPIANSIDKLRASGRTSASDRIAEMKKRRDALIVKVTTRIKSRCARLIREEEAKVSGSEEIKLLEGNIKAVDDAFEVSKEEFRLHFIGRKSGINKVVGIANGLEEAEKRKKRKAEEAKATAKKEALKPETEDAEQQASA